MPMKAAEPDKLSDELDVFDAARYFSGYNHGNHTQKRWGMLGGGRRISLDLPMRCSEPILHHHRVVEETIKERICNVKHKQPSSPGGRIASFLNSLFHQVGSKKNKSKSKSKSTGVEEEESPGGWMRRRRRSSISHFLSSNTTNSTTTTTSSSAKSLFSSSGSGFRTPPPYLNTPTKNYKQFLNYTKGVVEEKKNNKEMFWLDEKLKELENHSEKKRVWLDDNDDNDNDNDDDDGMESDSSSDLFELQNYELSRGGLPVYETTNVANINPI